MTNNSILTSVKLQLGLPADYTPFDSQVMMYINGVFPTLSQLGVGPANGFMIEDAFTTWDAFLGEDLNLNDVKTYMYLKVRLLFDPPTTGYGIAAMEKLIEEATWRISVHRESTQWRDPVDRLPSETPLGPIVIDGGIN